MGNFTSEANNFIKETALQYNLSIRTVEELARAIIHGNGTMAQFNLQELGGSGQWMKGGMTMVGDMFNNNLKAKVDQVCTTIANKIRSEVFFEISKKNNDELDASPVTEEWPAIFGKPTTSGSQNNMRYAFFPSVKRLIIDQDGKRTIYDTKQHTISGVSQQQGLRNTMAFQSQTGTVKLEDFDIISLPEKAEKPETKEAAKAESVSENISGEMKDNDVFKTIEKLGQLFKNGLITEKEYLDKKTELLTRI